MSKVGLKRIVVYSVVCSVFLVVYQANSGFAQGSIFGTVRNSDLTTPADSEICFVGYLDDTDEEIRIESCIGAGYENGNWYDDFQNYLTESPGNPYDYHFFNVVEGQGTVLSETIPSNSFQQEDILLGPVGWPVSPSGLNGILLEDSTVKIRWQYQPGLTFRIYRRNASSEGSFFRIDDPSGSLSNPGVSDSFFVDGTVDNISAYDYLVIPVEDYSIGQHSEIITVSSEPDQFLCGDANGDEGLNILDVTFIIKYLYKGGPAPDPIESADIDGRPGINLLDATYLVRYLYKGGSEPVCQ